MYYRELQEKNDAHKRPNPRGKSEYAKKLEASRDSRGEFKGSGKKKPDTDKIKSEIKDRLERFKNLKQPVIPSRAKAPSLKDVENKRKANQESIRRMKERKPYLYQEDWLTEGYKKIKGKKDDARIQRQVDRLDDDAGKAAARGNMAKEFRKDQQAKNLMAHHTIRRGSHAMHPKSAEKFKNKSQNEQARNIKIGARRKAFGIQPTTRRKVNPEGWSSYQNKLRRESIEEGYKKPDHVKMIKQIKKHEEKNIRTGPDTSLFDPKYRNDSRNKAFKMKNIRGALKRGEDPRRDTVGGRQKTPIDRRKEYTYNQKDRPAKKPGVQREHFVVNEEQRPLPMDKMRKQSDKHFKNIKTELGRARNSRDQATNTTDVRRFRRNQFNKDSRTDKVADLVKRRNKIDNMITTRNANPKAFSAKRARKSERNKNIGKMKRMM